MQGAVVSLLSPESQEKARGGGRGIKTFSREQSMGARGRITLGRRSTFPG